MQLPLTRRHLETAVAALVAIGVGVVGLAAQENRSAGPKFIAVERIARLKKPVYLTQPPGPGSQLYVVQKAGEVRVISNDRLLRRPFLDIRGSVKSSGKGDEQGMLSIAFPPDYRTSRLFYVAYTDHRDALRVVEYRRSADDPLRADRHSARPVLRIPEPTTKHHGGLLLFGPDGYLWIGSGDGGPSGDPNGVGQNKRVLLSKLLRIDPRKSAPRPPTARQRKAAKAKHRKPPKPKRAAYTIPKDNPFVGRPGRDEIWAYGLRNPWRFTFDGPTRSIAIGDVGNERYEEVDFLPLAKSRGANFGWAAYEGLERFRGGVPRGRTVLPAIAYPHDRGCAVTGGFVVRDPRLAHIRGRELEGRYIYGDYCTGKLFAFRVHRDGRAGRRRSFRFKFPYLTSFGEDNQNRIYVLTERDVSRRGKPTLGSVYRFVPRRKD
jgi:glucose/arabinose dehydrogenase